MRVRILILFASSLLARVISIVVFSLCDSLGFSSEIRNRFMICWNYFGVIWLFIFIVIGIVLFDFTSHLLDS